MGWQERLADVARFALRPTPGPSALPPWPARAVPLGSMLGIALLADLAVRTLLAALDGPGDIHAAPRFPGNSPAEQAFHFLVLAPLLEEALFRGWMSGRPAALEFALHGLGALALLGTGLLVGGEGARWFGFVAAAVVLIGLIRWLSARTRNQAEPAWFPRHFATLAWASTVLFAVVHLGNYPPLSYPAGLLLVMPQLVGGLLLAYTRTRLGLKAAMLQHAGYNAVFLAASYAAG
jgi:membrane protease YdiL (CAAX protease family)